MENMSKINHQLKGENHVIATMKFDNYKIKRLLTLLDFLDDSGHEMITSKEVEKVSFYSYRNINRIFKVFFKKSIGKYSKEKLMVHAAEQLIYSESSVLDIALELGYNDLQAFNKAFKGIYDISPAQFRTQNHKQIDEMLQKKLELKKRIIDLLEYKKITIEPFKALCLSHYGNYMSKGIEETWTQLFNYAKKHQFIGEESWFFGELIDDPELAKDENCHYRACISMPDNHIIEPEGFVHLKEFNGGNYVVFQYKGDRRKMEDFYENIFIHWIVKNEFEIADKPFIEAYLNFEDDTSAEDLLTDIYVPIN